MLIQHYPSQQTSLWSHLTKMRSCFILVFLLISAISTSALATVSKELHFKWSYDLSIPEIAGYKIYQEGQTISTINEYTTLGVALNVALKTDQANTFTITAFDVGGVESAPSAPLVVDLRTSSFGAFPSGAISLLLSKKSKK